MIFQKIEKIFQHLIEIEGFNAADVHWEGIYPNHNCTKLIIATKENDLLELGLDFSTSISVQWVRYKLRTPDSHIQSTCVTWNHLYQIIVSSEGPSIQAFDFALQPLQMLFQGKITTLCQTSSSLSKDAEIQLLRWINQKQCIAISKG